MTPPEVLAMIEKETKGPIVGREKGKLLEDLVKEKKPARILEIGTLVGYSAILMAQHLPENGEIVTLEIYPQNAEKSRSNIRLAGLEKKISVVVGDAADTIPKLEGKFGMAFIDAAKDEYRDYLRLMEKKLEKGAVVVADNAKIFAAQMEDYLDYVRKSGKYKSKFHDFGFDGVEVSVRL